MAFPQPNSRELANRKILEELQLKKQMLLKQGPATPLTSASLSLTSTATSIQLPMCSIPPVSVAAGFPQLPDSHIINTSQRAALHNANMTSCGFFVPQDSSFETVVLFTMSTCMKLKVLEEYLQSLEGFKEPKVILEQYATPSHIAAVMVYTIQANYDDIEGKLLADIGAGCGMLSLAAALLGANAVIAFEIDETATEIFKANREALEIENIDLVQCDVLNGISARFNATFDTVLLNPPFGTKHNAGIDMKFLEQAIAMSNGTVYSLHKTSTRNHIKKKLRSWKINGTVIAELKFNLPSTYKFHKKKSVDIDVDLWRFEINR